MNKEYYKQYYYYERNHWWFIVRNKIIYNKVKKLSEKNKNHTPSILNVGAATGKTSEMLETLGKVTNVEYDKECCLFLKNELGIDVINASIIDLPFEDNTFDIVCAFDVIEHVEDDKKATEELTRVCKTGGNIILTVPAFMSLWSEHDEINMHYRRYTRKQISKISRDIPGFNITYSSYFNSILFIPIWLIRILFRNKKNKEAKYSDFEIVKESNIINVILKYIFSIE